MDARLSPEQEALRDAAARMLGRLGPGAVGQLGDPERTAKLEAAVAAAGWRELRAPVGGGAPQASAVEVAVVAEELGRGMCDAPFVGPTLAAELRRLAGAPAATAAETVALGPTRVALAVADAGAPPPGATAIDATGAGWALLLVPGDAGPLLGRVALQAAVASGDLTRTEAAPATAPFGAGHRCGGRPLGGADLARWTALGLAVTAADLVGSMRAALDLGTAYAKDRRQFDRPIGSLQAVQHLLADACVLTEGSRSIARHAAWAVDALGAEEALGAAAAAKAYCTRAARTVCETTVQVHGGVGNTWECLAHVHLRRALWSGEALGGSEVSLQRVLAGRGLGGADGLR